MGQIFAHLNISNENIYVNMLKHKQNGQFFFFLNPLAFSWKEIEVFWFQFIEVD